MKRILAFVLLLCVFITPIYTSANNANYEIMPVYEVVSDFDIYLYDSNGSSKVSSRDSSGNVEIITFTATSSGYYTLKLKPYSNYADTHNINYAYIIN